MAVGYLKVAILYINTIIINQYKQYDTLAMSEDVINDTNWINDTVHHKHAIVINSDADKY